MSEINEFILSLNTRISNLENQVIELSREQRTKDLGLAPISMLHHINQVEILKQIITEKETQIALLLQKIDDLNKKLEYHPHYGCKL
jgi:hypothetical protein